MCKKKHAFVYNIHFKPSHQSKCFGDLIDNEVNAPICVLGEYNRETKLSLKHSLKMFFGGLCTVKYLF